jgi:hypothetical protein
LKAFENRMLRRIYGEAKFQEVVENCIMRKFVSCTLHRVLFIIITSGATARIGPWFRDKKVLTMWGYQLHDQPRPSHPDSNTSDIWYPSHQIYTERRSR